MVDFCVDFTQRFLKKEELYQRFIYSYVNRFQSLRSKVDKVEPEALKETKAAAPPQAPLRPKPDAIGNYSSDDDDLIDSKWKGLELAWLPRALESALQLCRWALPSSTGVFPVLIIMFGVVMDFE